MRITWNREKERRNIAKHGVAFAMANDVLADPLAAMAFDGAVDGQARWKLMGSVASDRGFRLMCVVFCYPDPDNDEWVHVISLREATRHERREYEIRGF